MTLSKCTWNLIKNNGICSKRLRTEGKGKSWGKRYVRTPEVSEFGSMFLVSCELYMGTFPSRPFTFFFFKAGTISGSVQGSPLWSGLNHRLPAVHPFG